MQLLATKSIPTFEILARDWHTTNSSRWLPHYGAIILKRLESNLFSILGDSTVDAISSPCLVKAIKATEEKGLDLAKRVLRYTTHIFDLAICYGYRKDNPALPLKGLLIPRKTKHLPALPLSKLSNLVARVENVKSREVVKLAFKINLHTFVRSSELFYARWEEIDFKNKVWIIPGERKLDKRVEFSDRGSKMRTEHFVPLSDYTLEVFQRLRVIAKQPRKNGFIFAANKVKPINKNSINRLLRDAGFNTQRDICAHGFRTMACSALNESGRFRVDAIEKQMSHQERNSVRAAYNHLAEYIHERKEIMQWWSNYIAKCSKFDFVHPYQFTGEKK